MDLEYSSSFSMKNRQFDFCRASLLRLPSLLIVDQVFNWVNNHSVSFRPKSYTPLSLQCSSRTTKSKLFPGTQASKPQSRDSVISETSRKVSIWRHELQSVVHTTAFLVEHFLLTSQECRILRYQFASKYQYTVFDSETINFRSVLQNRECHTCTITFHPSNSGGDDEEAVGDDPVLH
jgi:hypothetical protein